MIDDKTIGNIISYVIILFMCRKLIYAFWRGLTGKNKD
jgi:hypothetical protein